METERLITYIKQHIESILHNLNEFHPFGATLNANGELHPIPAFAGDDDISVPALLNLLEAHVGNSLLTDEAKLGAIAVEVPLHEQGQMVDAVQIRFYEKNKPVHSTDLKYRLDANGIAEWL